MSNVVKEKSFAFATRIVNGHRFPATEKKEFVLSKQLPRSATAIGALVREAEQAESKLDFVHKMAIALKEANETEYWILLVRETRDLLVRAKVRGHALFVVPALAWPPKGGTTNASVAMCPYLCSQ